MSTEEEPTRTEADAVAEVSAKPVLLDFADGRGLSLVRPEGWQEQRLDLESILDQPYRLRGTTKVENALSFVAAVNNQSPAGYQPIVYASEADLTVTAVLNQQQVAEDETRTGWGDHRVVLGLRKSPEWEAWLKSDQALMGQQDFAEFLESRIDEVTTADPRYQDAPDQATMLELAQSFQAHLTARYDRGHRLPSGETRLTYEEEITASAGGKKEMTIPEAFSLLVRPFLGHDPVYVRGRLRYRLPQGGLKLGYQLIRPDLVERTIFDEVMEEIGTDLSTTVLRGSILPLR